MTEKRAIGTVVTRNYFAYALALFRSAQMVNPEIPFYVLVIDDHDRLLVNPEPKLRVLHADELMPAQELRQMAFYYTAFELANALKATWHSFLWEKTNHEAWLYLDGDTLVFSDFTPLFEELSGGSVLLKSHISRPVEPREDDANNPLEARFLRYGLYNGGFLGMQRTLSAKAFLSWWKEKMRFNCREAIAGEYVDQLALNLVPLLFEGVKFCRHGGANVGYWNFHEAKLSQDGSGKYFVGRDPLVFFHFSGWSKLEPTRLSQHRSVAEKSGDFAKIGLAYREALQQANRSGFSDLPYGYNSFHNGVKIEPAARQAFWHLCQEGNCGSVDPFARMDLQQAASRPSIVNRALRRLRLAS